MCFLPGVHASTGQYAEIRECHQRTKPGMVLVIDELVLSGSNLPGVMHKAVPLETT